MKVCGGYAGLQEEVRAPFVIENLGCTGSEERLLDCPQAMDEYVFTYSLEFDFHYYVQMAKQCDAEVAAYAYVACGTLTDQGAQPTSDTGHMAAWLCVCLGYSDIRLRVINSLAAAVMLACCRYAVQSPQSRYT